MSRINPWSVEEILRFFMGLKIFFTSEHLWILCLICTGSLPFPLLLIYIWSEPELWKFFYGTAFLLNSVAHLMPYWRIHLLSSLTLPIILLNSANHIPYKEFGDLLKRYGNHPLCWWFLCICLSPSTPFVVSCRTSWSLWQNMLYIFWLLLRLMRKSR